MTSTLEVASVVHLNAVDSQSFSNSEVIQDKILLHILHYGP